MRLIKAMIREAQIYATSDSIFLDSPLNHEGFHQALELGRFIKKSGEESVADLSNPVMNEYLTALRGDKTNKLTNQSAWTSVIVTSNLRRAISTVTTALWDRLYANNEKVLLLSALQEISLNVDTKALSDAKGLPDLSRITHYIPECTDYSNYYNASENLGNKSSSFSGLKRLKCYNDWIFTRSEDVIITSGHSLWFKYYFQTYLSHSSTHMAKSAKIVNSGVVAFTVNKGVLDTPNGIISVYSVVEDSIMNIYGGFEQPKK